MCFKSQRKFYFQLIFYFNFHLRFFQNGFLVFFLSFFFCVDEPCVPFDQRKLRDVTTKYVRLYFLHPDALPKTKLKFSQLHFFVKYAQKKKKKKYYRPMQLLPRDVITSTFEAKSSNGPNVRTRYTVTYCDRSHYKCGKILLYRPNKLLTCRSSAI